MSGFGNYVRGLREARGLTQAEIEQSAGFPQAYLSNIERGRIVLPAADFRRRLARTLGVTHVDLLIAAGELTVDEVAAGCERDDVHQVRDRQREEQTDALRAWAKHLDRRTLQLVAAMAEADRETLRQLANVDVALVEGVL
jgi:transcriptional regulator with XRE-family HTH domain